MTETEKEREAEKILRRIHIIKQHIEFNSTCLQGKLLPNYTYLPPKLVQRLNLKKPQIIQKRLQHVKDELHN